MNKDSIYSMKGFGKVYKFTLMQTFKSKAYLTNFIVFILLLAFMGPIAYVSGNAGASAVKSGDIVYSGDSEVSGIYIMNQTDVPFSDEDVILVDTSYAAVPIEWVKDQPALGDTEVLIALTMSPDEGYMLNGILSDDSKISANEIDGISEYMLEQFTKARQRAADITDEDIATLQKGISIGSAYSEKDYEIVSKGAYTTDDVESYSMIYAVIVLMVVSLSSGYIITSIIEEKSSKLVENLLVSVRPLALVMGKILAMMTYVMSILIIGLSLSVVTNKLVRVIVPSKSDMPDNFLNFGSIFSIGAGKLMIMLISLLITYMIFGIISGILGSACVKQEDAGQASGVVMVLCFIGYFLAFYLPEVEKHVVDIVVSLVPFVSSYMAPVYMMCGRISPVIFIISLVLQAGLAYLLLMLCAKVYKKLIVNDSKTLKISEILKLAKEGE